MAPKNNALRRRTKTEGGAGSAPPPGFRPARPPDAPPSFLEKNDPPAPSAAPPSGRNNLQLYLQEIGKTPLLSQKEEIALARRILRGDREARDHMIKANLRLVVRIAHNHKDFGLPILDLISEGNIGLVKAIEHFDPSKGGKLSTYAAWWIKHFIKRALANQGKTIRLPVHLVDKISKIRRAALALTETLGREPADEELAMELQIPANKIAHLKSVSARPASLDAPIGEDGDSATLGEIVNDENAINPFDNLRDRNLDSDLRAMVNALQPRETEIIKLRFGLEGATEMTLEEVGRKFRVTRERVRQLQNIALSKMRKAMAKNENQRTLDEIAEDNPAAIAIHTIHQASPRTPSRSMRKQTAAGRPSKNTRRKVPRHDSPIA